MNGITGEEIDARIALVPALLDWACIDGARTKGAHYMSVVEGRNWPKYSSCADLGHWLLYRLGCRQPWINRAEHRSGDLGQPGWDNVVNVARLADAAPNSVRQTPLPGITVGPGDIMICWNLPDTTDAHVFLARAEAKLPGPLMVAEFGQPAGHVAEKQIERNAVKEGWALFVRGTRSVKRIRRWLPLHLVITNAAERGELVDVDLPPGVSLAPNPPEAA